MGGQRCPGHASKSLGKKRSALAQVEAAFKAGDASQSSVGKARKEYWEKLVDWSSTTTGAASLREQLAAQPDQSSAQAQGLRRAIDAGAMLAQSNREAENAYRAERSKGPLETPVPLTFGQEAAAAAEQAQRAAADAVAAADPLGLRAAEAAPMPQVTLPTVPTGAGANRPVLPTHRPIPSPTATMLPTAPPNRAAEFEALSAQATEGAAARRLSDVQAADAQRAQAESELRQRTTHTAAQTAVLPVTRPQPVAAQVPVTAPMPAAPVQQTAPAMSAAPTATTTQSEAAQRREQAAQARTMAQARNNEVARLKRDITARTKKDVEFARGGAVREFTAPEGTWAGPDRFTRNAAPATVKENWAAMRAGQAIYGDQFESLVARHAGRYTPAEVLDACQTLHNKGHRVMGGTALSETWYQSYQHLDRSTLDRARKAAISEQIGPTESALLAKRYVFANADGVLNRTLRQQPKAPRHPMSALTARAFAQVRKFENRAGSLLPQGLLRSSNPAYS